MRNLKISARLALGFGAVILMMLIISAVSGYRMLDSRDDNAMVERRQAVNALSLRLEALIKENVIRTSAVAKLKDSGVETDFEQAFQADVKEAEARMRELDAGIQDPQAKEILEKMTALRNVFLQGRDAAFKDLEKGDLAHARVFFNQEMPKLISRYVAQVEALSAYETKLVDDSFQENDRAVQAGLLVLALATLFALLFGPWFAWLVTRSITRPLSTAVSLATSVARRDLSVNITPWGRDEITTLEWALDGMVKGLQDTVNQVRNGADVIAAAAGQISVGNTDLASRTEQQSASLTETAASMEEMTATVRQNTESAEQAYNLTAETTDLAHGGSETVAKLVDAIGGIHTKSQQVAEIVGVIDSIAFQTNILALNAAVEAARAGNQGRGFAVVASEVRALAQRSATSAKEIKALIDATVSLIAQGNQEASRTGASVQGIVGGIDRVKTIMGQISSSSHEQTSGIEQINVAVTQMDDVTRQNASLVDESAVAAKSLQEQAYSLAQLVATFNLGGQPGTGPHTSDSVYILSLPEKVISPRPTRVRQKVLIGQQDGSDIRLA